MIASIVDDRARGEAMGAAGYLVKPISRESLFAVLPDIGVVGATPTEEVEMS